LKDLKDLIIQIYNERDFEDLKILIPQICSETELLNMIDKTYCTSRSSSSLLQA